MHNLPSCDTPASCAKVAGQEQLRGREVGQLAQDGEEDSVSCCWLEGLTELLSLSQSEDNSGFF